MVFLSSRTSTHFWMIWNHLYHRCRCIYLCDLVIVTHSRLTVTTEWLHESWWSCNVNVSPCRLLIYRSKDQMVCHRFIFSAYNLISSNNHKNFPSINVLRTFEGKNTNPSRICLQYFKETNTRFIDVLKQFNAFFCLLHAHRDVWKESYIFVVASHFIK